MANARKIIKKIGGSKRVSTRRSSSTRRKSRVMSRWKYFAIATLVTIAVLALAYYPILRPAFNRFTTCTGHKIYGACIPKGYSVYGIDISHHQGDIDWEKLKNGNPGDPPIAFVYIKATEGRDHIDTQFNRNWHEAQNNGFRRGAYHYFTAESSGAEQAKMFISKVKLNRGDLPPMVDIENEPKDADKYRHELKQFITTLERHYGVKPIIYTYKKFHDKYIDKELSGYPLWIARYNTTHPGIDNQWIMWQCTENGELPGIREKVDINIFNGSMIELEKLRIK